MKIGKFHANYSQGQNRLNLKKINLIYCQLKLEYMCEKLRQNYTHCFHARFNITPSVMTPLPCSLIQAEQFSGEWGLWPAHNCSFFLLMFFFPCSSVCLFHKLQSCTNCSSIVPLHQVHAFTDRLLQCESPKEHRSHQKTSSVRSVMWSHLLPGASCRVGSASAAVSISFIYVHLLCYEFLHELQQDVCSRVLLHGLQGDNLCHQNALHELKENLCSVLGALPPLPSPLTLGSAGLFLSHLISFM